MDQETGNGQSRKKRTGVFFTLALILGLGFLLLTSHLHLKEADHGQALERYRSTRVLFEEILAQRAEVQHGVIDRIAAEESFRAAMQRRDRAALLQNAEPLFRHLQSEFGISHFYIHTPANQVFLRFHKPQQFGERINRYLLDQAFSSRQSVSGIELGTHGILTMRTLSPWYVDGRLIGYIELGEELEQITRKVQDLAGVRLVPTVQKTFLDKDAWEEGMRMLGRTPRWDRFKDRVTIFPDRSDIADRLYPVLIREGVREMTIQAEGRTYLGKLMPIRNAIDIRIGDFLVVIDVTEETARRQRVMALMIGVSIILCVCRTWGGVTGKR